MFLFSLGSVSTLFRWGGNFCHMYITCFFLFTTVQKLLKSIRIFQSYDHKCSATFFMVNSVHIRSLQCVKITCKFTQRFLRNRSFCRGTFFGRTLYVVLIDILFLGIDSMKNLCLCRRRFWALGIWCSFSRFVELGIWA